MRDLAWVDLETTGLVAGYHDVIEACVIRTDGRTLRELDRVTLRVTPERPDLADPRALEIHGLDIDCPDAVSLRAACGIMRPLLSGALLSGHCVPFDRAFLRVAYRDFGEAPPWHWAPGIDTKSLALAPVTAGVISDTHLATVCAWLGVEQAAAHRAEADAQAALDVARRLVPLYAAASARLASSPPPRRGHRADDPADDQPD